MALIKSYSQDKKVCRVTFTLPKEVCENFDEICVVGDFNNWDPHHDKFSHKHSCLLYTSDAADERSSVDLGGRRIIKKTN